jgi:hypothetical protein
MISPNSQWDLSKANLKVVLKLLYWETRKQNSCPSIEVKYNLVPKQCSDAINGCSK